MVHLALSQHGSTSELMVDHLIAATGYRVSISKLSFLVPSLLGKIHTVEDTPVLSSRFESSVKGLYFVGVASANSFGPMARFAFGAGFTARSLSRHLAAQARASGLPQPSARNIGLAAD
jgi:hypothetical protein